MSDAESGPHPDTDAHADTATDGPTSAQDEVTFVQDEVTELTSVDGERIALHDFGGHDGGGPPLLLGHGNGLNAGMWAGALPHLTRRFRCHGLDLRGHGRSRPVDPDYPVDRSRFAGDIVTAVEALGGPVHYAAHSLGAAAAVRAALDHADPAELFTGLWLFEPVLVPHHVYAELAELRERTGPSLLIELSRRRRMDFASVDDAVQRFRSKPPYSRCDPRAVQGYVEVGTRPTEGGVRLSCRGEDEARVFEHQEPTDFAELGRLKLPTLVVSGSAADEANSLPPRVAPLVAEALGNARWLELDDVSHFGPMEQPATIARSIIDFFA